MLRLLPAFVVLCASVSGLDTLLQHPGLLEDDGLNPPELFIPGVSKCAFCDDGNAVADLDWWANCKRDAVPRLRKFVTPGGTLCCSGDNDLIFACPMNTDPKQRKAAEEQAGCRNNNDFCLKHNVHNTCSVCKPQTVEE